MVDGILMNGFKSRKTEALLAYLAYQARPQSRDHLAALFWQESEPDQANANLRKALSELRQHVGAFLLINREEVTLTPEPDWWVDAAAFQQFLRPHQPVSWHNLEQALTLYQGDFLAGFFLRDSLAFDEWASLERERLRLLALNALSQIVTESLHLGQYDLGITHATRWLNLDPLNEQAHRLMMRLQARSGHRNLALAQFAECSRILNDDLGVAPTSATKALAERIRQAPAQPFHMLPPFTPLVGRNESLAHISRVLDSHSLVIIVGPQGSGKTRLVSEAATLQTSDFRDGVYFVGAIMTGAGWTEAIARALDLQNITSPRELALALRGRELLLIWDDLESRTGGLPLINALLQHAPHVKCLLTAAQPTLLPEEYLIPLSGLVYPTLDMISEKTLASFPAVQLFLQQAQRVRLDFTLTPENQADVVQICQLVAGMPRELELAAATVRAFTPRQIAQQIAANQAEQSDALSANATRALWNDAWVLLDTTGQHQMAELALITPAAALNPQAPLQINLLGGFRLLWQNIPFEELRSRKAEALLAYLVCQPRPHARETLATMFWDESSQEQALANLRKLLAELPPILADYLLITRQTVTFDQSRVYWLDAAAFRHYLANATPNPQTLETVVQLYTGPFLADFHLPDCPEFESWVTLERERLRHQYRTVLHSLAETALHSRRYETGLVHARRLAAIEPLSEQSHRLLLLLLARQGHLTEALAQYEQFAALLIETLGITPTPETLALVERLQSASRHPTQLPPLPTRFMGREQEVTLIHQRLDDPACRLLTITGPGGVGKTTLALFAAANRQVDYLHGVYFVSLVGVSDLDEFVAAIAAALGFSFSGTQPPRQQLLNYLRQKELLLVLDNSETLSNPALTGSLTLILEILQQASQVKILATSRERFNITAEQACPILGLSLPLPHSTLAEWRTNEAVQLFLWRAQKTQPDFSLTEENSADVVTICRLVQGVPLGIELAAAAVAFYPVQRIAAEIGRNLDFLVHHTPEQADRHRSLRAVFTYSWQLLNERERVLFRQLSVFRGLFSLEAAQAVSGATRHDILTLTDKTMVRPEPGERYGVHELLRQYGAEKLTDISGEAEATYQRHAHYYTALLQQQEPALYGPEIAAAAQFLDGQMDNVRAAWRWAVARKDVTALNAAAVALSRYCLVRGLFQEGERLFSAAAEAITYHPKQTTFRALCLSEQARFLNEQALYEQAARIARLALEDESFTVSSDQPPTTIYQSLNLLISQSPSPLTTSPHLELGRALWRQGDVAAARQQADLLLSQAQHYQLPLLEAEAFRLQAGIWLEAGEVEPSQHLFEAALAIYQQMGDLLNESTILHNLGLVTRRKGDFDTARRYYEQALVARQAIGYRQGVALTLNNLGAIASDQGDMTESLQYKRQALAISRQIGDRYVEMMALINLGIDTHDQGAYEQAQTYYEQALALCIETGNRRLEGITRQMMTLLLYHRGDDAAALRANDEFAVLAESLNDQAMCNYVWLNRGRILSRLQQWAEAKAAYEQALAGWEGDLFIFLVEGKAGLAHVFLMQGALAQAIAQITPILDFLAEGNQLDGIYEPFQVYLTCYNVLMANGEEKRGRELLTTAHTLLQERAAKISDPVMRGSFLNNVTTHHSIMTAFQHSNL